MTSSLFVTFATDVTSTEREAIELEYQISPRWSVSGIRDQNGGFTGLANYNVVKFFFQGKVVRDQAPYHCQPAVPENNRTP